MCGHSSLTCPIAHGFAADDGATLLMAFRVLQAETEKQAGVHKTIAHELDALVADPFAEWAKGHRVCPAIAIGAIC